METNAAWLKLDEKNLAYDLKEACAQLGATEGELALDFSSVQRIDAVSLGLMEKLAAAAKLKQAKVVLRGVNVNIYKVLKVAKLVSPFSFLN